jgi:competence protein ComEC
LAQDWRLAFLRFSRRTLGDERAAFADALCFDVTDGLSDAAIDDFKKTGTIHILSASGFHVIVFSALVGGLLSVLPIPRPLQLVILGAILALYAVAAGFSAPIVRAVAMAMVARTAYLVRREPDFLSGLAAAAIGILLWQPEQLFSPGFQLSFITVAGLGMGYLSAKHPVFGAAVGSFVATAASAPLVAYHYGVLPVHSIPANLLIEVPVSIIVGLSMLLFPFGWGGPMEWVVGPCIDWVRLVLHFLASQAGSQVQIPEFNAYWLLLVYGLAVMLWRPRHVQP